VFEVAHGWMGQSPTGAVHGWLLREDAAQKKARMTTFP
jgi:hypothetical protein